MGGLTWLVLVRIVFAFFFRSLIDVIWKDYWRNKCWSAVALCSGAVAGLVAITPAAGFVGTREEDAHSHQKHEADSFVLSGIYPIWHISRYRLSLVSMDRSLLCHRRCPRR